MSNKSFTQQVNINTNTYDKCVFVWVQLNGWHIYKR